MKYDILLTGNQEWNYKVDYTKVVRISQFDDVKNNRVELRFEFDTSSLMKSQIKEHASYLEVKSCEQTVSFKITSIADVESGIEIQAYIYKQNK